MMSVSIPQRFAAKPTLYIGLIACAALALPPVILGPWLPFLDLVAFVGLDNLPPALCYGPLHYAVFQFTYIVHYVLSRAMLGIGIPASAQIVLFYLLQGGVSFFVIWRVLPRLVPEVWLCCVAVALGTLAFWDGFFIWGGPLPFSLAATAMTAATFGALREADSPEQCNGLLVPLLSVIAVMCHPFALPFALVLTGLRWLFVPARRLPSVALLVGLLVLGWIIRSDSPESAAAGALTSLFTWPFAQVPQRVAELFIASTSFAYQLFGFCPTGLQIYFVVLGAIHLLGFVASPIVVVLARENRPLRLLAALNTVVAILYFCSRQNDALIPGWPWRILTFHSPVMFLAGIAGPLFLLRRWRPAWLTPMNTPRRALWAVPVAIVGLMLPVQIPLLTLGNTIGRSYEQVRASLLQSGITNALVVVTDVDAIKPFYLRCVPFLLFSDPQLVARNLLFYTEWHIQNRHPTRLAESWLDLGRASFQASFSVAQGVLEVRVIPQAARQTALSVGNNQGEFGGKPNLANMEYQKANSLMQLGCIRDAILHYEAALRIAPNFVEAHNNLGVALLSAERRADALEQFNIAARLRPDYADAQANIGAVLLQLGRTAEAREQFRRALQLNPNHAAARDGLERTAKP